MPSPSLVRQQLRARAMHALQQRNQSSVVLWQALALALGKIIGDQGFESMFFRCVYQNEPSWPWLAADAASNTRAIDHLAAALAARDPADAEQASLALLGLFTDTMILLVGELVTNRILLTAWGTLAADAVPEPPQ